MLRVKERLVSESTHMRVVGTRAGKPQVTLPSSSLALLFPQNAKLLGGNMGGRLVQKGLGEPRERVGTEGPIIGVAGKNLKGNQEMKHFLKCSVAG